MNNIVKLENDISTTFDINVLKSQGFFCIKQLKDGTYKAQYDKTTYYGLYVVENVVKQKG
jgi:hypothetical protein